MAGYRRQKSQPCTNEAFSLISTLSKSENLNLAAKCIEKVSRELEEAERETCTPIIKNLPIPGHRSTSSQEVQMETEDSVRYFEGTSSKQSESPPPNPTDSSLFHESYDDDSVEYKTLTMSHSITKIVRRRYNHIFKLLAQPLFEKSQVQLLRIKSLQSHVHKSFKQIKLTPAEKKNILLESAKRLVLTVKIHYDQISLWRWYLKTIKSDVKVPKYNILPHSRLKSGIGILDHVFRCGSIRYHGNLKQFLSRWKEGTNAFFEKIEEIQKNQTTLKWLKRLSYASVHFFHANEYLSMADGFSRWKQCLLEAGISEAQKKYEDYVGSAQIVAFSELEKIFSAKKASYFGELKMISFKMTIMRCKIQHLLHLLKKSLRNWLLRLKAPPKVIEASSGKSHLLNLAHIVKYNIKAAFSKWKSLPRDEIQNSERLRFRKTILRNLNFIINRDLARAFETWKNPDYIEEIEEVETVTKNVVTRVDQIVSVKIFIPKQRIFTSLEYKEEQPAEPTKKSHRVIKVALRNLDRILQISLLQAWTKWNQPISADPKSAEKHIEKKFISYEISYKPICRIESSGLNEKSSFICSGESFYNSTLDNSSFIRNISPEEIPEGLHEMVAFLYNTQLKKLSLSRAALFDWQKKAQDKILKKKNLQVLVKNIRSFIVKREKDGFEKWQNTAKSVAN